MMGDFVKWKVHLDGLHKMVEIRGGFETLNDNLKSKVWRYYNTHSNAIDI
jgi:hypothetical protein